MARLELQFLVGLLILLLELGLDCLEKACSNFLVIT